MPRKNVREANANEERKMFYGFIDASVHHAIKSAAKVNGRTMAREVSHRLARSVEADHARKPVTMRQATR